MILNTKRFTTPFEEIFPQELNKCLQKFYLSARCCEVVACESNRFSFALRRWGRPQRRRAKEKRMLSQASEVVAF